MFGYLVPSGGFLKPGDPWSSSATLRRRARLRLRRRGCSGNINDLANGNPGLPLWDGTYQRVIDVFGKSDVFNLPPAARDRRFFFQQYSLALVKY